MSEVALGCGNFGGVGSAPAFFGQGIEHDEAFAIMDRAWQAGITSASSARSSSENEFCTSDGSAVRSSVTL